MKTLLNYIFLAVVYLLLCAGFMAMGAGCTPNVAVKEQQTNAAAQVALGGIAANLTTIDGEASAIASAAGGNASVLAHVSTIRTVTAATRKDLDPMTAELAEASKLRSAYQADEASLKIEHSQFWSDRQRAIFWWAVGITAGLAVLVTVAYIFMGAANPIGGIAKVVCHTCSLGLVFVFGKIRLLLVDIQNRIAGKTATATSTATVTTTATVTAPVIGAAKGPVANSTVVSSSTAPVQLVPDQK